MSNTVKKVNPEVCENEHKEAHFQTIKLTDCNVPIGCPWGLDPDEDVIPNHHKS